MKCKHAKREGESCMLNNNCKFPNCENDLNMKTIKVERCEGCYFEYESDVTLERWCIHPDIDRLCCDIYNSKEMLENCPLKTEPVKIELK